MTRRRRSPSVEIVLPDKLAHYGRVSTLVQAERATIEAQREYNRDRARRDGELVYDEYYDDGVSGTLPFAERPQGRRLLEDARAGRFNRVAVFKIDRFGRDSLDMQQAEKLLREAGVTLVSYSEQMDLSTASGKLHFQMLSNIAELDRNNIIERTVGGRDRCAADGLWTGGVLPFGYDVEYAETRASSRRRAGRLILSDRMVPELGMSEVDVVRDIFARVRDGSTAIQETDRLNHAGVEAYRRYPGGNVTHVADGWSVQRVTWMLHNTVYRGLHVLHTTKADIEREVPRIVDDLTWFRVQDRLTANRRFSHRRDDRHYPLAGMVVCGIEGCGGAFGGTRGGRAGLWYYRCTGRSNRKRLGRNQTCYSKSVPAQALEDLVWEGCVQYAHNPDRATELMRAELAAKAQRADELAERRHALSKQLHKKEQGKDRILQLYRDNHISAEDVRAQLTLIAAEMGGLSQTIEELRVEEALARVTEAQVQDAALMLAEVRQVLAKSEEASPELRERVIRKMVARVIVETDEGEPRRRTGTIRILYRFGQPDVSTLTSSSKRS
jgi:site-specific DNA recombinase